MSAAFTQEVSGALLIKRITDKAPKSWEMNFLGTGWCFFTDFQDRAYWLHVESETLIESSRNTREE